jgi:PAS domain-containing protein
VKNSVDRQRSTSMNGEGPKIGFQRIIDTTPALIHTALPDGSLDYFNERWLAFLGVPLEEVRGWRGHVHPRRRPRGIRRQMARAPRNRRTIRSRITRAAGGWTSTAGSCTAKCRSATRRHDREMVRIQYSTSKIASRQKNGP